MGSFLVSQQLHNTEDLSKEQFVKEFKKIIREKGYVVSNPDGFDISYGITFSNSSKWVTVISDMYEPGDKSVLEDAGLFAKELNMCCINVNVIDSDFAMLEMFNKSTELTDMHIVGDASGYMENEEGTKEFWEPFLIYGSTWKQFLDISSGQYTFVEDSLIDLAPLIGMDSENILLDGKDIPEENTIWLYFEKANNKKKTSNNKGKIVSKVEEYNKLKINGNVLIKVSNEDIKNGTFKIPNKITIIGQGAFSNCTNLEYIVLPKGITQIEDSAFSRLHKFKRCKYPKWSKKNRKSCIYGMF